MAEKFDDVLSDMQIELAKKLLDRIKSGEATAAEFNVARQLLKDNGMESRTGANPALDKLSETPLPTFDDLE